MAASGMTIKKYRRVEDMENRVPRSRLAPENIRIACDLTELAYALHPWFFEPGVQKFRSAEEAESARSTWKAMQIRKPDRSG